MAAWIILVTIIIVCLTILMYSRRNSEGFLNAQLAKNIEFGNKNTIHFRDSANKGILTNPGLSLAGLNDALKQPDIYLSKTRDRDYTSFFVKDPESIYTSQDALFCKKALYPLDLPARQKLSAVGCGWWFHPTQNSVGVLGSLNGPVITEGLPPGGKFYWNLEEAALKEDFKKCKRITSCDLIDTPGIKGVCGWCDRLGHAVPINTSGAEKYPDTADEDSCGENVINGAGNCPQPDPEPVITEDGEDCGRYGRPSADNSIRLYNDSECSALGGNFQRNGECLKQQGGSYSWDCRTLNLPRAARTAAATTCTPDSRGRLSRACLIQIAMGLGFTKQGGIYTMLNTTNRPNENEKLAIQFLSSAGISVPNAVLGDGNIDKNGAANIYMAIYNTISRGKTEKIRQSAKLLAIGTSEFDVCTSDGNEVGPFNTTCLQRAFRSAGCQPAGRAYPNANNVAALSSMTWDQINTTFKKVYDTMSSKDLTVQDKAMQDCVGFKYERKPIEKCGLGARYVYILQKNIEVPASGWRNIQLAQVQVFDDKGQEVARGKPTRASSTWPGTWSGSAVDGNAFPRSHPHSFHDMGSPDNTFWMVDLGKNYNISMVRVFPRTDCCQDRYLGMPIQLKNDKNQIIAQKWLGQDQWPNVPNMIFTVNFKEEDMKTDFPFDKITVGSRITLRSATSWDRVFRHAGFVGWVHGPDQGTNPARYSPLQAKDASYIVRNATNGRSGYISFESVNFPGYFIRHAGFRLYVHRRDGSGIFNDDSSFRAVPALNNDLTMVSFQSSNFPDRFIVANRDVPGEAWIRQCNSNNVWDSQFGSWKVIRALG